MKRLAYFSLEGLLQQGAHEVWITLGTYPTAETAQFASGISNTVNREVVKTRVMPLYRISELPEKAVCHTSTKPTKTSSVHDSVTVA